MATNNENRSLWKRLTEKVQTFRPVEPGSYKARELSMDTQRENAINWLSAQPYKERNNIEFGAEIPAHLLNDHEFAVKLHGRFGSELADKILPSEVKSSTEYQASTADSYKFLNAALQHDERSLQLEVKDHDTNFSQEDKQHAINTVRRMGSDEALQFVASLEHATGDHTNEAQQQALNALSNEVLGDKEFLLGLDKLGVDLNNLPQHVKQSDALMRECLEEAPAFFEVASSKVRSEQASFDRSLKNVSDNQEQAAANYSAAEQRLKDQPQNFLKAHRESMGGVQPRDVPAAIRNNKDVIEELLKETPDALRYASRELRRDKQFISDMTAKYKIDVSRDTLIKDREVALNLTKTESVRLDQLPESLQTNREFVLNVVRLNGEQLKYASDDMRDDFEIALMAAQQGKLEGCSDRLRNDPYLVSKALEADPRAIEFASAEIRDNEAFGLLAVRADPSTVAALSERLRNSVEVAQAVVATDPSYTEFLGQSTRTKLIANLGQADREAYEYAFTEGDHFAASRAMSKGFEGMRATQEREILESSLQQADEWLNHIKVASPSKDHEQALESLFGVVEELSSSTSEPSPYAEAESYELSAEELAEIRLNKVLNSQSLTKREDIATWLNHYKVSNYTINDDLTVDVRGDVNLKRKYTGGEIGTDEYVGEQLSHTVVPEMLSSIPFQFGKVDGNFDISENSYGHEYMDAIGLKSLKGSPIEVKGTFDCSNNANLSSLEHAPKSVGGDLNVSHTQLRSLDSAPQVSGQIVADGMPQIKHEVESHDSKLTSKIGSFRTISPEEAATAMAAVPAATQAPATAPKTKQKMKI